MTRASIARCAALIAFCLAWRKSVVLATVLMFIVSIAGFGFVQQQFFPTSTRTELFLEMRLPEGTAIGVTDATAKSAEQLIAGDDDVATYTTYVGQGAPRFWIGLNPVLPNSNFAQIVIVTKNLEARERVKAQAREGDRRGRVAGGAHPRRPLRVRPAGRLPGAVPRGRPRSDEGPRHRGGCPQGDGGQFQDHRSASRLERAGQVDPPRGGPGPRPRARADAAGCFAEPADADHRPHGDAVSRGDREHRRGGARDSRRSGSSSRSCRRSPSRPATASRCRCRRSRGSTTNTRSRSCGGATATSC